MEVSKKKFSLFSWLVHKLFEQLYRKTGKLHFFVFNRIDKMVSHNQIKRTESMKESESERNTLISDKRLLFFYLSLWLEPVVYIFISVFHFIWLFIADVYRLIAKVFSFTWNQNYATCLATNSISWHPLQTCKLFGIFFIGEIFIVCVFQILERKSYCHSAWRSIGLGTTSTIRTTTCEKTSS